MELALPLTAASTLTLAFRANTRLGTIAKTFSGQDLDRLPALMRHQAPSSADRRRPTHPVVFRRTQVRPAMAERRRRESALGDRPASMFLAHRTNIVHMFVPSRDRSGQGRLRLGLASESWVATTRLDGVIGAKRTDSLATHSAAVRPSYRTTLKIEGCHRCTAQRKRRPRPTDRGEQRSRPAAFS
jgi:hypothetical protein